jgi:leucyl-tRNA synthetase
MPRYNPKELEPKWQQWWDEHGTYTADLTSSKPKYIAMSMFNYPSGAGIHIGHAMNYTISDVKARFKRQQGYESYHPVGWDAFGLPAENYAIKTGVSPQESMATIIPMYHKQYKAMGWSNDWTKEIATHEPEYYRWTQWIFCELYRSGLVYQDSRLQWWCPIDNTVLANEQVLDGKCWRHDGPNDPLAEKREVKQWFFKITDYADELLEAIDDLDWTESVKLAQKNWIGKSVGAEVDFKVKGSDESITVFTTRPDTLFGATFMVVAPESDVVKKITAVEQKDAVEKYVVAAEKKTEVERQAGKEKTGVFTGAYAINPVNDQEVPIWTADYVLAGYGTGAIMAVPAHDERDWEFAQKFDLPIVRVVKNDAPDDQPSHEEGAMVNSGEFDGQASAEARENIVKSLEKKGVAKSKINYRMRDWSVSRQRYWGAPIPIIDCPKCGPQLVPDEELPVMLPKLDDYEPAGDGRSALARATDWLNVTCPNCGGEAERETDTMDTYVDSSWYMLRYFDPHNDKKIFDSDIVKKWEPIDFYNGADHATAHLLYARFITRFFTKIGLIDEPEPFKHFLFNGKVTASNGEMFSKSKGNGVDPLEIIEQGYGADALRTYLMFAAPLELWVRWDPQGVPGAYRFLSRLYNLVADYVASNEVTLTEDQNLALLRASHPMVKKVTEDIEGDRYNTAIAAAMGAINDLYKFKTVSFGKSEAWQQALENIVACVAPFAPHVAEELWHQLGHESSVHAGTWPQWDDKYLVQDTITIAVQVNGKLRGEITIAAEASEEEVVSAAKANEKVASYLNGEPKKVIYVAGKLVNFVI